MGISIWQILIVVLIVVVLFGAGRIPRLMGDMAKGIKSFKAGMKDEEEAVVVNTDANGQVEQGTTTAQASTSHKDPAQS
ncbi:MAG: twin-arginine translocase TatA/TatE family subunit [Alphaproteobacteria bacterium]|jgi:sec-independent protein translocase protein TatA